MKELIVSPSPHIRSGNSTQKIMLDVIIALVPAMIASVVIFGPRAALITAVCVGSCVLLEYLCRLIMKREQTISDLSAVVTGILLAMNLPVTIPLWVAIFGCFIAIVVAKQLFGGIGQNFANPAIAARVILLASFSGYMTAYTVPFDHAGVDAVLGATPLAQLASGGEVPTLLQMFLGDKGGCIGEVSCAALLLGGIYLVIRKVIHPITPLVFIGTVFLGSFLLGQDPLYQILSGGLFIGAIFMATDYATSPVTRSGKAIFAFGCGLITILIRFYGGYPEGVSFAILLMNILTPQIDKFTRKIPLGAKLENPKKLKIKRVVLSVIGILLAAGVLVWTGLTLFKGEGYSKAELQEYASAALPEADTLKPVKVSSDDEQLLFAYKAENGAGAALVVTAQGYNKKEPITMMVGFNPDGVIQGVKIIDQHETEGIGTNVVADEAFLSQFVGKTAGDLSIDVVAGATFTSEGILSGCQKAAELYSSLQSEILG